MILNRIRPVFGSHPARGLTRGQTKTDLKLVGPLLDIIWQYRLIYTVTLIIWSYIGPRDYIQFICPPSSLFIVLAPASEPVNVWSSVRFLDDLVITYSDCQFMNHWGSALLRSLVTLRFVTSCHGINGHLHALPELPE